MTTILNFWLHGQPPRKSNSRRVVFQNGKTRVIKSAAALQWVQDALLQIPADCRVRMGSAEQPVEVVLHIYYESRRPDLSGELVLDVLQAGGVIANDRYVEHLDLWKHYSDHRPGVDVTVRGM